MSLSTAEIVAIVVTLVVVLPIAFWCAFWCWRRKTRADQISIASREQNEEIGMTTPTEWNFWRRITSKEKDKAEWDRCHIPVFVRDPKQWCRNRRLTLQSEVLIYDYPSHFVYHLHFRGRLGRRANNEWVWVKARDQRVGKVTGIIVEEGLMDDRECADLKSKTGLPVLVVADDPPHRAGYGTCIAETPWEYFRGRAGK